MIRMVDRAEYKRQQAAVGFEDIRESVRGGTKNANCGEIRSLVCYFTGETVRRVFFLVLA